MKRLLLVAFMTIASIRVTYSQSEDTLLTATLSPFLKDLLSKNYTLPPVYGAPQSILQTTYPYSQNRAQVVIKKGSDIYIFLEGTGKVYKSLTFSDSSIIFRRVDKTVNMNYNGGGLIYVFNGKIHVYGGYGFWKNNGTDKVFNEKSGEWDVVPLSDEIIASYSPFPIAWHNSATDKIIVPYQMILNSGISDPTFHAGKIVPVSYELDLKTKKWSVLGNIDPNSLEIMRNTILKLEGERGFFLHSEAKLYEFDLINNQVFQMTDQSITQSFGRLPMTNFRYERGHMMYYYDPISGNSDSLWLDPSKFKLLSHPVYAQEDNTLAIAGGVSVIMAILLFAYWRKRRNNPESPTTDELTPQPSLPEKIAFTDTELGLIRLLKEKMDKQETANLSAINYVLGVKDKNIGLQKKVRSDVIKSVNQKYRHNTGNEGALIQSIRSETDKRYFEYLLADTEFDPEQ